VHSGERLVVVDGVGGGGGGGDGIGLILFIVTVRLAAASSSSSSSTATRVGVDSRQRFFAVRFRRAQAVDVLLVPSAQSGVDAASGAAAFSVPRGAVVSRSSFGGVAPDASRQRRQRVVDLRWPGQVTGACGCGAVAPSAAAAAAAEGESRLPAADEDGLLASSFAGNSSRSRSRISIVVVVIANDAVLELCTSW